jgi:D-serine deaminase-like pyridoxal phosphate-dependent protein
MAAVTDLRDIPTPAALVELDKLARNAAWMSQRAHELGVRLRPHVKTHKTIECGKIQVAGHFGGVTVSTLVEAKAFADAGFRDITWAVPAAIGRLAQAFELAKRVDRFTVLVDHEVTLAALEQCASERQQSMDMLLKIDCGNHRSGVDPTGDASIALATRMSRSARLRFAGVLAHAGHCYGCRSRQQAGWVAKQERDVAVGFADRLRRAGILVGEVSIGSTPTMRAVDALQGVTEIRPGNYVFFDAFQVAIGSCVLEDVAFSVLTSVVGSYPHRDTLVVDAGALALSKDEGARHVDPDCGYGVLLTADGRTRYENLRLLALTQEHGVVRGGANLVRALRPGQRVRVVPNHSCLAAACFERYYGIRDGRIVTEWRPARGW